ncbi:hypothetical protein chiPu_0000211 [Chiloscyllium punctatum]|uniref:RING-type E3 ubiquitin transferase n=1 Tax=Chiloscyllium punctatum TaxID=137246 RepID=A0A401RUN0_CHIPU|nr:hypothetical protein [Chiloscyllium punctatum]
MMSTKQVTCRYFMHGVCREGSRCMFSHDLSTSKPSTICKFYQKGQCAYGDHCRYDHVRLPGSRAVGPVISRVTCTPVAYDAVAEPATAEPTVPVKVTESGRCKKKTLELKDRDLCNRAAEKSKLFPFPPSYCNSTKTASHFSEPAKFAYEDIPVKPPSYLDALANVIMVTAVYTFMGMCVKFVDCRYFILLTLSNEEHMSRSCPECRVVSEFVIPSAYWVEDKEEKDQLIEAFKQGMSKKACKYFDKGKGSCPFGGKCLYLHAYPDGTLAVPEQPRKQLSSEGNVRFLHSVRLWDFIEEREHRDIPQSTAEDEVAELGDLFMHLSGADEHTASNESLADQPVSVVL